MAQLTRLTLADISLDLQIAICIFLRPIDILALRKTCKAFELSTRRRVVWLAAFHRVCLDNTLFLPSFPVLDMSSLELEQAATAPHRWIELCSAFEKQHLDGPGATLYPRTTRFIRDVDLQFASSPFLVPGGRYVVVATPKRLLVLDLGYLSKVYCTLVASVGLEGGSRFEREVCCEVQATPDNKGLIILVYNTQSSNRYVSIYEIYPQRETPLLTRIGHLDRDVPKGPIYLLSDTLIFFFWSMREARIVIRFWDYRANYSTCFSSDVGDECIVFEMVATKTAICILCRRGVLVWAVPPLLPHSPDHFLDDNPTHLPPLFRIPFPDNVLNCRILAWKTTSSWYFGSRESISFDVSCRNSELELDTFEFKLIVKPDLSDASLHAINTSGLSLRISQFVSFIRSYRICEDTLVSYWGGSSYWGVHTGSIFAIIPGYDIAGQIRGISLCPVSGRCAYFTYNHDCDGIVVVDLI